MQKKKYTDKYYRTKQLINDTFLTLIDRMGLENISVEDVCKEANITRSNFYYYYKNMNDLILERFKYMDKFFDDDVLPHLSYSDIWKDLSTYMNLYFEFIESHNLDFVKQIYIAQISLAEDRITSPKRSIHRILMDLLEDGQKRGQLQYDPKKVYEIVLTYMKGLVFKWCINNGTFNLAKEGKKEVDIIIKSLELCNSIRV